MKQTVRSATTTTVRRLITALVAAVLMSLLVSHAPAASALGGLAVTTALKIEPTSTGSMRATFTVANSGAVAIKVDYFLVGARTATGGKVDFPTTAPITLQPGQSYTYSQQRTLAAGSYTAWPAYYDGTNWIELAPHVPFTVSSCPSAYGGFGAGAWPPSCWRPYRADSPFNQPIPAQPAIRRDSQTKIDYLLDHIATYRYPSKINVAQQGTTGEPTYWSKPTDPQFTPHCMVYKPCAGDLEGSRIRIPARAVREGGASAKADADRHLTVVDQSSGWEYDFWQVDAASLNPTGGDLFVAGAGKTRIDGDGTTTAGNATASYFGSIAGRVRAEEVQSGVINHALFIDIDCDNGGFVFPARHRGQSCSDVGKDPAQALPMGSWLQLAMTDAEINAPTIPAWERPYLRAMASYGMFVGDTGSANYFGIEAESGNQYTALGYADPWLAWAKSNQGQAGWSFYKPGDDWVGTWTGVDWKNRLRVLCQPRDTSCPR